LERDFNLCYHGNFTLDAIRKTDSRELEWFYGRLIKQIQDENESRSKQK